jgi:hypothetical protein
MNQVRSSRCEIIHFVPVETGAAEEAGGGVTMLAVLAMVEETKPQRSIGTSTREL